jgi:hypothetical protein
MQEIVVIPAAQMRAMLLESARTGALQALEAYKGQDRMVNQADAAALLGVTPNYFSASRLWEHIPYSTLVGGEKRYRVSDVLAYKGPADESRSAHFIPDENPVMTTNDLRKLNEITPRRGRPSLLRNLSQNAAAE